jgi:5,10-methylenetetrahydrofolate reductase
LRLSAKTQAGIEFFTSQVIFNADVAIWTLRDYDEHCKATGCKPARLIFTFAPFARADTATFLKWLGVEIPLGTEKRILSRRTREEGLRECVELCRENFKRILYAIDFYNVSI